MQYIRYPERHVMHGVPVPGTELAAYHNEGSLRPFHVIAREGTIVNARPGALTAAVQVSLEL